MRALRVVPVAALVSAGVFAASGTASAAPLGSAVSFDCRGGDIAPGVYELVTITGVCFTSVGNVVIHGNLTIAPGALLDDVTAGDPTSGTPVVSATVSVGGNVFVGRRGDLLLGCSPNITCGNPPGVTYGRIGGDLTAFDAQGVVVHSTSIGGNVSVFGGGGGAAAETCNAQVPHKPIVRNLEPWSKDPTLDYTPVYTDFEDDSIGGSLSVAGLTSCWLGSLRNQIGGSATYVGNKMGDPDAMEVANNVIRGDMICYSNKPGTPPPPTPRSPGVQFGDSGGAPNIVVGSAVGQCGFNVTTLNPPPEAGVGPGIREHITVSAQSLQTSVGTYTSTEEASLSFGTTESKDKLFAELDNFAITGAGLRGSGTYNSSEPPGSSGEAFLATEYPNGSVTFTVFDTCNCSFGGQRGTITIRAYGTSTAKGLTTGSFVISSGGGPTRGSLRTLAGYGTFSNVGEPAGTIRLIEHLAIT